MFCWILDFFSISLSTTLYHIFGVSSFNFILEGVGWLHHWTKFQLILNLIAWGIWFPSYVLVTWGIVSPLFLASFSFVSSIDRLIKAYNISGLSSVDRYRDNLNLDSWGSSLILGMILWLIIGSYQFRYLGVLLWFLRIKPHSGDGP